MIRDIEFYSQAAKAKVKVEKEVKMPEMANREDQHELLNMMAQRPRQSIGLSKFSEFAENFYWKKPSSKDEGFPKPLKECCEENKENLSLESFRAMALTVAQIDALEKATVEQSNSLLWHEQRIGRITATKAHSVMHTNIEKPAASLIKAICNPSFEQFFLKSSYSLGERSMRKMP